MSVTKLAISTLVAASAVFFVSAPAAAKSACPAPDDQKVVADIQAMFDAAAAGDWAAAKAHYTPDAYLFDGGGRYDVDGIFNVIRDDEQKGVAYLWKVTHPEVHFLCDTAWIAYTNQGGVTQNGKTTQVSWLESMILTAKNGHWLIRFVHSTVAKSPAPLYAKPLPPFAAAGDAPPRP